MNVKWNASKIKWQSSEMAVTEKNSLCKITAKWNDIQVNWLSSEMLINENTSQVEYQSSEITVKLSNS